MAEKYLLYNGKIATGEKSWEGAILIDGDRIRKIWDKKVIFEDMTDEYPDAQAIDLNGWTVLAGGIDAHVHFREPGMTRKGNIASESAAALAGGVTSFVDMPNTNPPTTDYQRLIEKIRIASGSSSCNYGFNLGATNTNAADIEKLIHEHGNDFGAVKLFMGSSTGNMLVDNSLAIEDIFSLKGKTVMVHSEDENTIRENVAKAKLKYGEDIPFSEHPEIRSRLACIRSTALALEMAMKHNTRLHLLHVSTAEEVEMVRAAKIHNHGITAETSGNYLWFCDEDYEKFGARIKCNPAIKSKRDRDALRRGLADGVIDTIGSDHAPHLVEEKAGKYAICPSGIPSVGESLHLLLTVGREEGMDISRIASAFSERIADVLGIEGRGKLKEGYFADIVVVDTEGKVRIGGSEDAIKCKTCTEGRNDDAIKRQTGTEGGAAGCGVMSDRIAESPIRYNCGWSPYSGMVLDGIIKYVFLNGKLVVFNGMTAEDDKNEKCRRKAGSDVEVPDCDNTGTGYGGKQDCDNAENGESEDSKRPSSAVGAARQLVFRTFY